MAHTIAIAGKGGTGKTTITGLMIKYLIRHDGTPILAVDADANSNLNEVLGVEVEHTLGDIREEVAHSEEHEGSIPSGVSKADYMEFKMNQALIEEDDYDMIVMGRTEGKGCYCFVNGLLQTQLQKLTKAYKYIVVDNEAGMEHISRGTLPSIDTLVLVSDCSRRGIQAVGRIAALATDLDIHPEKTKLIVNRAPSEKLADGILEEIDKQGLDLLGVVPHDETIYEYDAEGKPTCDLPSDSKARVAVEGLLDKLFE